MKMDMKRFLEILEQDGSAGVQELRANSLLQEREQIDLDTAVIETAKQSLVLIEDVRSAGLVRNVGLGAIISQYQKRSSFGAVQVSMSMAAHDEQDAIEFKTVGVPIPIVSAGFNIDARMLAASRRDGTGIDVDHAVEATRAVAEQLEQIGFNGASVKTEGAVLYGLRNHPNRNTTTGSDWGTVDNIEAEVLEAIAANENDNYPGPYNLYVNRTQRQQMRQRIGATAGLDRTAYELVTGYEEVRKVAASLAMPDGEMITVDMRREVLDLAVGMDIMVVPWEERGAFVQHWRVMAAMALRIKSDFDGRSGVCHTTGN